MAKYVTLGTKAELKYKSLKHIQMQNSKSPVGTTDENSTNVDAALGQAQLAQNPMLGEVALSSTSNKYKVIIYHNGKKYEWFATRTKYKEFHYTDPDIWSNDTFLLKRSIKKKMKKLVEAAVCNLA